MIRRSATCKCVRTSSSIFKMSQTCLEESSLVMRHGILSTTQKSSARAHSRRVRRHRGQRKQDSQSQKSKSYWSHSSMWEASSTVSFCYKARQSTSKSTKKSCGVCFAQCAERNESCGRANCGCFNTIHLLTMPWASGSFWQGRTSPCWNNLPIHLTLLHVTFFFSHVQGGHQGDSFWRRRGHQEGCNDGAEGHFRRILLAMHRSVAEKDGKVH